MGIGSLLDGLYMAVKTSYVQKLLADEKILQAFGNLPKTVKYSDANAPLAVINNLLALIQGKRVASQGTLEMNIVILIEFTNKIRTTIDKEVSQILNTMRKLILYFAIKVMK